jgi:hypothetical protein
MTWKTMDDPPAPTCMVLFFGRHKTSNLRHYEVGTVDPAWGCVEIIPTHWMSLPSPPGIADQPTASLPCGCHVSLDDSYGGCVLCKTVKCLTEAEDEIARLTANQPDAAPTPREHRLMDLLAEAYEYIDADSSEQPPFMARIREALGVGDRPADQQSACRCVREDGSVRWNINCAEHGKAP